MDSERQKLREQINQSMLKFNSLYKDPEAVYIDATFASKLFRSQIGPGMYLRSYIYKGIYFHTITIDQSNPEYRWKFDCCRTIVQNVLQDPNVKSGIVINASFYQLKRDYSPVGFYKTETVTIDTPHSEIFKLYGGVCVKNGRLDIINNYNEAKTVNYDQVITAGPMLIDPDFTEQKCDDLDEKDIYLYRCQNTKSGVYDKTINCNDIIPGSLTHGCQDNPRSAIGKDKDGNITMVYVEGRGMRGKGATFAELSQIGKSLGLVRMINLDGGNSSQIMWRREEDNHICQLNPHHTFVYPVGSTISYVKTI